jgi:hypothetical protein
MSQQILNNLESTGVFRTKINDNFTELYNRPYGIDTSVRSLTSKYTSTYTTVQANSASWAIDSTTDTGVRALTAGWVGGNSAYTNLVSNSAAYLSAVNLSFLAVSGNWNSAYSTVQANSASWAIDSTTDTGVRGLTAGWVGGNSAYTTVQNNSASWAIDSTTDTGVRALTSNWVGGKSAYTTVQNNSSNWSSVYTTVYNNSASYVTTSFVNGKFLPLSGGAIGVVTETKATPTISTNTLTLDLATASLFYVNLNAAITTFTLTNVPTSPKVFSFTLQFVADGTARTVTWPTGTRWSGGTGPTITSTANKVDTFTFLTHDGGANWFAYTSNQNQ